MKENTNKTIAVNTIILYIRLAIVSVCGLLYTRFSLQALGIDDFGLFSVVACVITFASIVNTIMIVTSNRFMAIAIGKYDIKECCKTFNVNLIIHTIIAILTIIFALPIGHWYISSHINYEGDLNIVYTIFNISIIASAVSFISVPYNGLLLAKEKFFVFCITDVFSSLVKLIITFLLIDHFDNKIIIYALVTAFMTVLPTFVFWCYTHILYKEITHFALVKEWRQYWEVIKFSSAIAYGAFALIIQTQGSALLINMFFNTAMNAGVAVATSVSNMLQTFANNAQKSISPQIVKSYAQNNQERCFSLVCLSSKITYLAMLFISMPFLLIPEVIFGLWLKEIPPYAIIITRLLIINILINSISTGLADYVFASGNIKEYQFIVNSLIVMSIIVGYFLLKSSVPPESLYITYIIFSIIATIVRPIIVKHISHFKIDKLVGEAYAPLICVTVFLLPIWLFKPFVNNWVLLILSYIYLCVIIFFIGLKEKEQNYIVSFIKKIKQ